MNNADIGAFAIFRKEMKEYLTNPYFHEMPYKMKPFILNDTDMRCNFAVHILLGGGIGSHSQYILIDRLIDCTIALEALYLTKDNKRKGQKLALIVTSILNDCNCDI